jgi:hypothetical protein
MTTSTTFSGKLVEALHQAANELEKFRLQAALGKAEARDRYEDAKKKFSRFLVQFNTRASRVMPARLAALLHELRLQLALGRAATRSAFEKQRTALRQLLGRIERFIHRQKEQNPYYLKLLHEIEKFRIKLEIVRVRLQLGKMEVQKKILEKGAELRSYVNKLKEGKRKMNSRYTNFRKEMSEAYAHLRLAFAR